MSSKITFYIARHGKTILNILGRVQGWSDTPLIPEGIEVAEYLGRGLQDIVFDAVYTSDLRRTRETMEIILRNQGQTDLPIIEKKGFREVGFGSYESGITKDMWKDAALYLHYTSGDALMKDIFDPKKETTYEHVVDSIKLLDQMGLAEGFSDVEKRSHAALFEIIEKENQKGEKESNVLIVSHGTAILLMLQNLGGKEMITGDLPNASICRVVYENEKFKVESIGDMSYVEKGKNK